MSEHDEYVRRVIEALPYAQTMGLQLHRHGDDCLIAVLPFAPQLIGNPAVPSMHGGILGGLLQFAATAQLMLQLRAEAPPRLSGMTVQYLRPGRALETRAQAVIEVCGRRFASASVRAYQDDPLQPVVSGLLQFILVD